MIYERQEKYTCAGEHIVVISNTSLTFVKCDFQISNFRRSSACKHIFYVYLGMTVMYSVTWYVTNSVYNYKRIYHC